ncbi:hypothetical protein MNEG_11029 [Monoraphidium neglectum]|jgi:hypothetical protein|uniref:Uncharacterized protein n=1 Tax=Monoraphidium neglectum TaxID=145388 RepID=A0A0D2MQM0_9CHLO|nr:hypothetical protein MNEG_11029 [Monoraphidium neglectum]KIY96935.1 hypothetical protein MNEG_11029 [Monoraphidium neglectum]|eukprot:XP_013895955.1 hypothetical protein MNEG_11029 [Monoraphidium neglectum]
MWPSTKLFAKRSQTPAACELDTKAQLRLLMRPPPPPRARGLAALRAAFSVFAARAPVLRAGSAVDGGAPAWVQQSAMMASSPSSLGMALRPVLGIKLRLHESMLRQRGGHAAALTPEAAEAEWGAALEPAWEEEVGDRFYGRHDQWRAQVEMAAFEMVEW